MYGGFVMNIKKIFSKILFLSILVLFILIIKSNAYESVSIDISAISENFNNSKYVTALKDLGISISATQKADNSIVLDYDDSTITYSYDSTNNLYSVSYPITDEAYEKYNILSAIFIDSISTMQGNPEGSQIALGLDDSFCYSFLKDDGVSKNYFAENGTTVANYQINPSIKMPVLSTSSSIADNIFLLEYETFYPDEDCLVKSGNLIFYKTFSENGDMELYIGDTNELNNYAYNSILTAISLLFDDARASYYLKENYTDFSIGNTEFDGISVSLDETSLPVSNIYTILLPDNMKYAKFTINRDIVKSKLDSVQIPSSPQVGDTTNTNNSFIIILAIAIVLIIILIFIKKRKKAN